MQPHETHLREVVAMLGAEVGHEELIDFWNSQVVDRNLIPLTFRQVITKEEASSLIGARLLTWFTHDSQSNAFCQRRDFQSLCDQLIGGALEIYRQDHGPWLADE